MASPTTPDSSDETGKPTPAPLTRAEARAASLHRAPATARGRRRAVPLRAAESESTRPVAPKRSARRRAVDLAVMTVAAGIVATMALPAYAFTDGASSRAEAGPSDQGPLQQITTAPDATPAAVVHDTFKATTEAELAQRRAEKARKAAEAERARYAASYTGPSVNDFLKNPTYPDFDLGSVFGVAKQYIGTPYVFGGSSPAGFDCSGFIQFVYAQFGIPMSHSVVGQAAQGTRIALKDAVPGDVVIMNGHDGFYAGNGNILDAPRSGQSVSIRPIWTNDFYIVRFGI